MRRPPASLAPLAVTLKPPLHSLVGQRCPRPPSFLPHTNPRLAPTPRGPRPSTAHCVSIVDVQLASLLFGSWLKCPGPARQPSDQH